MKTTYANQKAVTLVKAPANKDNVYGTVNKECMYQAMQELKYNEFKIYMYFITNKNGYRLEMSTKHIAEMTGASQRKIQESINTLIEKGYLVTDENTNNEYIFYEDGQKKPMYKKDIGSVQKVHRLCTNSTQSSVQKVHSNITDITNILYNSTISPLTGEMPNGEKNISKKEKTKSKETHNSKQDIHDSYKDKLVEFLKYNYNLQSIPKSFWDKVNEKDISLEHIYDMWKQSLTELLKINDGNQRKGNEFNSFQRLYYDLTILANKHDEYLANLAKHEHVSNSEFRNDISTALTDNAVYKNIVSNPVVTVTDELNNLDEWI